MNSVGENAGIGLKGINLESSLKADPVVKEAGGESFKDVLKGLINQVDSLQKDADASIHGLVTGANTDVHNVAVRMEEAGVAFDLMMEIRNKLLEAYQEISRMQP